MVDILVNIKATCGLGEYTILILSWGGEEEEDMYGWMFHSNQIQRVQYCTMGGVTVFRYEFLKHILSPVIHHTRLYCGNVVVYGIMDFYEY